MASSCSTWAPPFGRLMYIRPTLNIVRFKNRWRRVKNLYIRTKESSTSVSTHLFPSVIAPPLPVLASSSTSWLLRRNCLSFQCLWKGSYTVRYLFYMPWLIPMQLFSGLLGIYSGIFAIYLQLVSKESRTTTFIFYSLCLLYILSTATVVSDFLFAIIGVSNKSISKNIIFFFSNQLCRCVSIQHRFSFKLIYS